jgi:hypothetical protein
MTFTPQHPRLDPAADNFSESVLLTAIAADARTGVFARLCRYPDAGVAWVWLHVVADGRSWTFVDDDAPCGADRLDLDGDEVTYDARPAVDAVWRRAGRRQAPAEASLDLALVGPFEAQVHVSFTPGHATGASLPGRTEVLGRSAVRATVDGHAIAFEGVGQWHEQEQSAPRFLVPFTYCSLAGDDLALLGLIGPRASGGFVRGGGRDAVLRRMSIEPTTTGFAIEAETDGGDTIRGTAAIGHAYTLPVYGRRWSGTFVTAEVAGRRLTGFVNRWDPHAGGDPS